MMTFPTEWKNNPNVPNHQQAIKWITGSSKRGGKDGYTQLRDPSQRLDA